MNVCEECGNDDAAQGHRFCIGCLERLGHAADPPPCLDVSAAGRRRDVDCDVCSPELHDLCKGSPESGHRRCHRHRVGALR